MFCTGYIDVITCCKQSMLSCSSVYLPAVLQKSVALLEHMPKYVQPLLMTRRWEM